MNFKIKFLILICLFCNIFSIPGKLDTNFNSDGEKPGTIRTKIFVSAMINSIIFDGQKKIVAAGAALKNLNQFALARFRRIGILDESFNPNESFGPKKGVVSTAIGISSEISSIVELDDKIIAAGISRSDNAALEQITLVKYNNNGSLDRTFNPEGNLGPKKGIVIPNLWLTSFAGDLIIDANKNIIVVGSVWNPSFGHVFAVLRYKKNGRLDRSFNANGTVPGVFTKNVGNVARAKAVAIDSQNRILVAGYSEFGLTVFRCRPNGTLDPTFNQAGSGIFTLMIGNDLPEFRSIALDRQGRIYLVGQTTVGFTLVRLKNNGTLDQTFNPNGAIPGVVMTEINQSAESFDLALDLSGNILVNGSSTLNNNEVITIARYRPNGRLDRRFNFNGNKPGTTNTLIGLFSSSRSMIYDKLKNKIIVGGSSNNRFALAKYLN